MHQPLAARRLVQLLFPRVSGLLGKGVIVIGPDAVRIQSQGRLEFFIRLFQLAHFIEQFAVLHQSGRIRFFIHDAGNFFNRLRIRSFAAIENQHLIVLFFEGNGGGIFRIHF